MVTSDYNFSIFLLLKLTLLPPLAISIHPTERRSRYRFVHHPSFISLSWRSLRGNHNFLEEGFPTIRLNDNQEKDGGRESPVFDFSSRAGWEQFYGRFDNSSSSPTSYSSSKPSLTNFEFEFDWHNNSIGFEPILDEIEPGLSVLMVGTGSSSLPRILYDRDGGATAVTCLDYSLNCIKLIQGAFGPGRPNMHFITGDATRNLPSLLSSSSLSLSSSSSREFDGAFFDVIVDKGLLDALMCDEGWDGDVERYLQGIGELLSKRKGGKLVLVSYGLSSSVRDFLNDVGGRNGIVWNFDKVVKGNDNRVSFSIGYGTHDL